MRTTFGSNNNFDFIFANRPSKVTTDYHLKLGAYLSESCGITYIWCDVNEAWIESTLSVEEEVTFNFESMESCGFSTIGNTSCTCGNSASVNLTRNATFTQSCDSCGLAFELQAHEKPVEDILQQHPEGEKPLSIPTLDVSLKRDLDAGLITIKEAAVELFKSNWIPFVCVEQAKKKLGI